MSAAIEQLIAEASVISEATAAGAFDKTRVHGGEHNHAPAMAGEPLADEIRRRWNEARGEFEQHRVLHWARTELARRKRKPDPPKELLEHGSTAWKRHIAREMERDTGANHVKNVCRINGCSRASAYRYMAQYGEREAA